MFSFRSCLELVVYFLVLVFLNNISLTFVSKKTYFETLTFFKKLKELKLRTCAKIMRFFKGFSYPILILLGFA